MIAFLFLVLTIVELYQILCSRIFYKMADIDTAAALSGSSSSPQQPQVPDKYHQQQQLHVHFPHHPVKYEANDQGG